MAAAEISPLDSLFISENPQSLEIAQMSPIGTVTYSQKPVPLNIAQLGTDFIVYDWFELPDIFSGDHAGYWGEAYIAPKEIFIRRTPKAYGRLLQVQNPRLEMVPLFYGGRYLSAADEASKRHLYTAHLLAAKNYPKVHGGQLKGAIMTSVKGIIENENLHKPILTYVPPRPKQQDRMALFLDILKTEFSSLDCVLGCVRDYDNQRNIGNYSLRKTNVAGAFRCVAKVRDKDFVLIDDIGTSFHTVNECADTLLKAGANKVAVFVLGLTCGKSKIALQKIQCSSCGRPLVLRFRKETGQPFWGCSGYPRCKDGLSYLEGVKQLRELDRFEIDY
ncbi:MAG: hypothetical protein N2578_05395 [Bdellovibrionaceae bacterium]|nr:hypothetical protein [Pseudobdellovibrionaceae bacterium]